MDIQYYGANCVRISSRKANVVVDDNMAELGQKTVAKAGDLVLVTNPMIGVPSVDAKIVIDMPGEYEVSNISIQGVVARSHMDPEGKHTGTMFKIIVDDIKVAVVGHVYPELSDVQLEALGAIDILVIPVGDSGYTLDSIGALKLIKKIEPKIVIPTHYADKALKYEVPQQSLEEALKGLSMEPVETVPKLKVKPADFAENTQLIILERQ
ncbi:MAG TPA: MBL fold metallo-hydrolase [Candidatus Saccharimonadales bacterium]|nr:MBL fold metallo-hydrolase [Candidatus Saccharimonadales bacterium]